MVIQQAKKTLLLMAVSLASWQVNVSSAFDQPNLKLIPSWGTEMPPTFIELRDGPRETRQERPLPKKWHEVPGYPLGYATSKGTNGYGLAWGSESMKVSVDGGIGFLWQLQNGHVIPFGRRVPLAGQVFRVSSGKMELVEGHKHAVPPTVAVNLLHLPFDGRLTVTDRYPASHGQFYFYLKDDAVQKIVGKPEREVTVSLSARVPGGANNSREIEITLPREDVIDIGVWKFKFERIVWPEPDQEIAGWIDVRVSNSEVDVPELKIKPKTKSKSSESRTPSAPPEDVPIPQEEDVPIIKRTTPASTSKISGD